MAARTAVLSPNAPAPSPLMSQAVIYNNTVYCSGSLGIDPATGKFVEGGPYERTVRKSSSFYSPRNLTPNDDFIRPKLSVILVQCLRLPAVA